MRELVRRGLVDPAGAIEHFEAIAPLLYKYPAVDPGVVSPAEWRS